jgi:hypothetical protein
MKKEKGGLREAVFPPSSHVSKRRPNVKSRVSYPVPHTRRKDISTQNDFCIEKGTDSSLLHALSEEGIETTCIRLHFLLLSQG